MAITPGEAAVNIRSEVDRLEKVIVHMPGAEVENMTPENAERALYSDILNLHIALAEYRQMHGVLSKVAEVLEVKDLLQEILQNPVVKEEVTSRICRWENVEFMKDNLCAMPATELATALIEGVIMEKDNLTKFLAKGRYDLMPLHNFFFMRDPAVCFSGKALISKMASVVRERESIIMESIFRHHPSFGIPTINPLDLPQSSQVSIEGGDVIVAREDVLLVGTGTRTTTQGIDFLIDYFKKEKRSKHIIVQELPFKPESFIHLDMVFTLLDHDKCMVYEPVILRPNKLQTVHIELDHGKIMHIRNEENLLTALRHVGFDLEPVICGGRADPWIQEREQWHSGTNFFALAPGKVIGYARNQYTLEELSKHGFEILKARSVIKCDFCLDDYHRCVITIEGSELARGGGGARCMTMPVKRKSLEV